jgi:MFS family permease
VYQIQHVGQLFGSLGRLLRRGRPSARVSQTVVLLGLTSLFTDLSSEMVAAILPLYVVFTLGFSPLQFGVLDGIYQGSTALVRLAGGFLGDRWGRHKEVAATGYGVSAVCKLGLVGVSSLPGLSAIVAADRAGKGIRTAPRDAMISLSSDRAELATAFGVHRAFDTAGALVGPLLAFGLLALAPDAFDAVFVVSFCLALIGLGVIVLFVENPPREAVLEDDPPLERATLRGAAMLFRESRFRLLTVLAAILGLFTISDAFLYLGIQRRLDFDPTYLPLLYVGTALVYMLLAVPVGQLADRIGRGYVFLGGYALLLLVYALLLLPTFGSIELVLFFGFLGGFYAATDGVLMALASRILPAGLRGSGLALLVTSTSLARLFGSVLFGGIWTAAGIETAVVTFGVVLAVALGAGLVGLRWMRRTVAVA